MKALAILLSLVVLTGLQALGQDNKESWFDFWVGHWVVTWAEADGSTAAGTNTITRVLDGKVIQEDFRATEGTMKGYLGRSLSVYNPRTGTWHQGYADNQGGYFNFVGDRDDDRRIFKTEMVMQGEKRIIKRMVFYDITADSLMWDWEGSEDGGKTWTLRWRIHYKRMEHTNTLTH